MKYSYIHRLYSFAALDAFKDKEMPDWIKNHPLFRDKKEVKKVFPRFGLKNFRQKANIDPEIFAKSNMPIAIKAVERVSNIVLSYRSQIVSGFTSTIDKSEAHFEDVKNYKMAVDLFSSTIYNSQIKIDSNGIINLNCPIQIMFGNKKISAPNESIFRVLEKLKNIGAAIAKKIDCIFTPVNVDTYPEIKEFNKANVPGNLEIVFSSEGEGAWDLATISMRGIKSCQDWDKAESACLIGTIASKYVGVIYLTSGADYKGKGSKMSYRCMVRFGIDTSTKAPCILIDRMYPSYDERIAEMFTEALSEKSSIPVLNYASVYAGKNEELENKIPDIELPSDKNLSGLAEEPYDSSKGQGALPYEDVRFRHRKEKSKEDFDDTHEGKILKIIDEVRSFKTYLIQLITETNDNSKDNKISDEKLRQYITGSIEGSFWDVRTAVRSGKINNKRMAIKLFLIKIKNYIKEDIQLTKEDPDRKYYKKDPLPPYEKYEKMMMELIPVLLRDEY